MVHTVFNMGKCFLIQIAHFFIGDMLLELMTGDTVSPKHCFKRRYLISIINIKCTYDNSYHMFKESIILKIIDKNFAVLYMMPVISIVAI